MARKPASRQPSDGRVKPRRSSPSQPAPEPQRRQIPRAIQLIRIPFAVLVACVYVGLAVWAWGSWSGFFSHPVRTGMALATLGFTVSILFADPSGAESGRREDRGNRWVILPLLVLGFLFAWLPPFAEARGLWTFGGDAVRYTGLALFLLGGVLRVVPMYILGHRFSALVAIQENHRLVTTGIYSVIRHPSYLGGIVLLTGWSLGFRSLPGLLLLLPLIAVLIGRINAEERLLASEFGEEYRAYQERTRRLIPYVY